MCDTDPRKKSWAGKLFITRDYITKFDIQILAVSARKKLSMWSSCLWVSTSDMWQ
jgi:hypothetical protein